MAGRGKRLVLAAAALLVAGQAVATPYGLVGRMTAKPGQRDALIAALIEGTGAMPGCLSYVVAKDGAAPDAIIITEVWDSRESHAASLKLPVVRAAIAKGRPLVAGMETIAETEPVGGVGLDLGR